MRKFGRISDDVMTDSDLTDDNVHSYITDLLCCSENNVVDEISIEGFLEDLDMSVHITAADARETTYFSECFERQGLMVAEKSANRTRKNVRCLSQV